MYVYIYGNGNIASTDGKGFTPRYQNVSEDEEPNLALVTRVLGSPMTGHNLDQSETSVTPERFAD